MSKGYTAVALVLVARTLPAAGQGPPAAPRPDAIKQLPPPGKQIPQADRKELEVRVAKLWSEIEALREDLKDDAGRWALLPDVEVYHKAVRWPLVYDEPMDVAAARAAVDEGMRRAAALRDGKPDWLNVSGPRGYVSRIDGSVQPYVLIVPDDYANGAQALPATRRRLDFFCHGRDETLMELKFISARHPPAARDHFLVNLYGRYCNANKFAGEIDLLEVLEAMKQRYPVDENRVVVTGFSMGGAACWHFAVHYADLFAAASPGAGFAETRRYLKLPDGGAGLPWYERKLWHWYDCTDYAANLFNLPTIAYAGELDPQKQASEVMEAAMREEGLTLERLTGPGTKHEYHKETKQELDRRLTAYAERGRNPLAPKVRLTTWTLRYNRMHWVTVDGLDRHWERATVDAEQARESITATTRNVSGLTFDFREPGAPFTTVGGTDVVIDGIHLRGPAMAKGKPWFVHFGKGRTGWRVFDEPYSNVPLTLRKEHGLQGPIDDAFLDSFVFVLPTGKPLNEKVGKWVAAESERAMTQWRKTFRGEPRVKRDIEVTDKDVRDSNLILWGDPSSNKVLGRMEGMVPIQWNAREVQVNGTLYPAANDAVMLIYPNPLNRSRYVVLNSGFTFREADHSSNARQVPKLPDYAIVDVDEPPGPRAPGRVVRAGFFDEQWMLQPDDGRGTEKD